MVSRKRIVGRRKFQVFLFLLLTFLLLFLLIWIHNFKHQPHSDSKKDLLAIESHTILYNYRWNEAENTGFSNNQFQYNDFNSKSLSKNEKVTHAHHEYDPQCIHLSKCFDYNKCKNGFSVYVHPDIEGMQRSPVYENILKILKASLYITDDPAEACISILSLDTHDRDIISANYVKNMNSKLKNLPNWNNGQNHLVIVFFSGTWPDYLDTVSFYLGKSMIARASSSLYGIRKGYDISIPLVPKDYPISSTETPVKEVALFPLHRKYLMSFKGKRYLYGIGSMSRNILYLIRNKKFVLLTTCRHGKGWEKYKDERCDEDNEQYDRYDYEELLRNSTFCLIPRGRRLGSFRFLESMKYGCIPVLLSNGWDLPFKDLIDWSKFSLNIDERILLQLPTIIESLSEQTILSMRQQTLFIYQTYFSSMTSILKTMLEEVRERVIKDFKRPYRIWNQAPGALKVDASYASSVSRLPFYGSLSKDVQRFTAIVLAVSTMHRSSSALFRLIQSINTSKFVDQILVIWLSQSVVPTRSKWPKTKVSLRVVHPPKRSMNARYINMDLIRTDAIFSFDEDVVVNSAEIDFAFTVWLSNPDCLVGFAARSHLYDTTNKSTPSWKYTSRKMNSYSIIQTSSAVFHRYYSHHYSQLLPRRLQEMVNQYSTCESLAMNFLITSLTGKSPIKVTSSSHFKPASLTKERLGATFTSQSHFDTMQKCFDLLVESFGYVPLVWSKVSMNPVLYKDPVSIVRKKYKKLEP